MVESTQETRADEIRIDYPNDLDAPDRVCQIRNYFRALAWEINNLCPANNAIEALSLLKQAYLKAMDDE